jgi:iron complex outermembrane receptor protein
MRVRHCLPFCVTALGVLGAACDATAAAAGGVQLQEVVVTAQRRAERLENVPMSITVLSPATVQRAGITNFMELGEVTNGVQMNFAGSIPGVAVRGVTSTIAGYNIETNVAVYIDGFYDPQPLTIQSDIANLQDIQVLKGPQGTLYGRNATGGAILINTLGPTKTFTGKFDASYGNYNTANVNGYVAGPINDRVRASLSAHYQHGETTTRLASPTEIGKTIGPAGHFEEVGVRAKLQADLTDKLQATLGLNYASHSDPRANFFSVYSHILPPPYYPAPPLRATEFGTTAYVGKTPTVFASQYEATLKLAYTTPIGTLTSYTSYAFRRFGADIKFDSTYLTSGNGYPFLYNVLRYKQDTIQEAVDYNITAINHLDLNVGAMYYTDKFRSYPGLSGAPTSYVFGVFLASAHTLQNTTSWAVYADGTYHLTEKLSLNAGGRFSSDDRDDAYDVTGPGGSILTPRTYNQHTWKKFTPRVTVRYELAPRTNVYLSWSKGYRQGAFNPAGPICNAPVAGAAPTCVLTAAPPETITAYEAGFKAAWSRIRIDAAVFHYDYKNLQIVGAVPDPFNPLNITSALQSAPVAKITGFDAEVTVAATERLNLHAAFEVLRARYGRFPNASGTGVDPTNSVDITGQTQDWTGLRMPRAPSFSGNAGFDYTQPLPYGSLLVTANVHYMSRFSVGSADVYGPLAPAALQRKQRYFQPGYALVSAQVTWTDPSDHYSVTLYGNNLTNKSYFATQGGGPFGDVGTRGDPITGGVRVGYRF